MDNTTITETVILTREEYDKMISDIRELRKCLDGMINSDWTDYIYEGIDILNSTQHYEDKP